MAKLYFIGGEDVKKICEVKIHKKVFSKGQKVLAFLWTTNDFESIKKYQKVLTELFYLLCNEKCNFADFNSSTEKIKEQIKSADVLYLPGGNPKILIKKIKEKNLANSFRNYEGSIIGNSAGSMVMADKAIVIKGQDGDKETWVMKGFSLANVAVSVHYGASDSMLGGENADYELGKVLKKLKRKIYAIPEESCLFVDNEKIRWIGNGKEFE